MGLFGKKKEEEQKPMPGQKVVGTITITITQEGTNRGIQMKIEPKIPMEVVNFTLDMAKQAVLSQNVRQMEPQGDLSYLG